MPDSAYAVIRPGKQIRLFLVAEVGTRVAGYSITCIARDRAELVSIAISSQYQGRGIGSRLLRTTLSKAAQLGAKFISLTVRPGNQTAIRLYRRFGFERTRTVRHYYENGSDGWRMKMAIQRNETV